jgi:hypothetical protein
VSGMGVGEVRVQAFPFVSRSGDDKQVHRVACATLGPNFHVPKYRSYWLEYCRFAMFLWFPI